AIHGDALPAAVGGAARRWYGFEIELEVSSHAQIEQPLAIVIDERAARSPADARMEQAGLFGDICKGSVTVVPVQDILAPVGDEQVVEAIIIEIANSDCRGPSRAEQAGLFGHIGKGPVAIVLVHAVRCAGGSALDSRAAQKKDVEPAVIIVIDKRCATTDGFEDVLLPVDSAIDHRRL